MLALFAYLLLAFISVYCFTPQSKTALWKYALLIPLTVSGLYLFFLCQTTSDQVLSSASYLVGKKFAVCIIPAIICGAFIYSLLRKKINNERKVEFPKMLFTFTIVALGLGLFNIYLEKNETSRDIEDTEKKFFLNQMVRETVKQLKNKLPMNAGDGSIAYNAEFDEDKNNFTTYYKETEIDKSELTQEKIDFLEKTLRSKLLETTKNNPANKAFIEAGTTLTFDYSDKNGEHFLSITFTPNEYK